MRPLDPLEGVSELPGLILREPVAEVRAAIERAGALPEAGGVAAALAFARGALALREGALDEARRELERAATAFEGAGEREAGGLSRCEALLAALRRGPRGAYGEVAAELEAIAVDADEDAAMERVWVVATHHRALAERLLGHAAAARRALHAALARSEPFPDERARVLTSLGALYVGLGAFGAGEALLELAVEIHHGRGDVLGEAAASGELAAAALGLGDLEWGHRHLERQQRLCARVGDAAGRARALATLAEVLLELDRPDDAAAQAASARAVAEAAAPPERQWAAQAGRVLARARRGVDDAAAALDLDASAAIFAELGSPLGAALATWDRAYAGALDSGDGQGDAWFTPAWALASLGLGPRVAQLLRDRRLVQRAARPRADYEVGPPGAPTMRSGGWLAAPRALARPGDPREEDASERTLAAVAQSAPRVAAQQEVALLFERPDELAALTARRVAAQRNLGRLAALTLARPGLLVAAVASARAGAGGLALPPQRAAAACVAALPEVAVWVWPASTPLPEVGRDLAALRVALGEDARAALAPAPDGRVMSPPFAGEACAELEGVALAGLLTSALALPAGALGVDPAIPWSGEVEARVVMAGYVTRR